ncbi:hypothetical protein OQA88_7419 [Cercophora sp. LCS_1]
MSGPARTALRRTLERWPRDALRPDFQFQDIVGKRLAAATADSGAVEQRNANALNSLIGNRYMNKYKLSDRMLTPQSNPTYYKDLIAELEEAPNRSWMGRLSKKFKGMFRMK